MHHPEKREAVFAPSARVSLSLLCFTRSASWLDLVKASSGQFSELKKMEMAVRSARPKNGMSSRFSGSTPRFEPHTAYHHKDRPTERETNTQSRHG